MAFKHKIIKATLAFSILAVLYGCAGGKKQPKLDYATPGVRTASDRLVIPPDITGISSEDKYTLPEGAVRASEYNKNNKTKGHGQVLPAVKGAHLERAGNQRWLVITGKMPDELWPGLYAFWQNMGFVINKEERETGFMETQWAENRANIPGDPLRDFLTSMGLGGAYSSSIRDKFIVRVEPDDKKGSVVSFTNQKREEVFVGRDKTTTKWVSRPSDKNLEAQFLARYMLSLGLDRQTVAKELSQTPEYLLAALDHERLFIKGNDYARNKYRLKMALERTGLTILNFNDPGNEIIVSPAPDNTLGKTRRGFFGKLFGGRKKTSAAPAREQIKVVMTNQGNESIVQIYDRQNKPYVNGKEILTRLYLELR